MGITGVPTFIIANRYAVVGAQAPEVLAGAIAQATQEEVAAEDAKRGAATGTSL
jgi:predicted DsbA family dithiol-disulfide isomerase